LKVAVITYDVPHLKTRQVVEGLLAQGHDSLTLFALPFKSRQGRKVEFQHRPFQLTGIEPSILAEQTGAAYTRLKTFADIPVTGFDFYLISGAGVLPDSFVIATERKVINSHPGLIPLVRGLDAFKWAIIEQLPIGNTLHFIESTIDLGIVIRQVVTPLYASDSLEEFANRHYGIEIDLLTSFESYVRNLKPVTYRYKEREARRRMPLQIELGLRSAFEKYKRKYANLET